jgi:hypothetical protein
MVAAVGGSGDGGAGSSRRAAATTCVRSRRRFGRAISRAGFTWAAVPAGLSEFNTFAPVRAVSRVGSVDRVVPAELDALGPAEFDALDPIVDAEFDALNRIVDAELDALARVVDAELVALARECVQQDFTVRCRCRSAHDPSTSEHVR